MAFGGLFSPLLMFAKAGSMRLWSGPYPSVPSAMGIKLTGVGPWQFCGSTRDPWRAKCSYCSGCSATTHGLRRLSDDRARRGFLAGWCSIRSNLGEVSVPRTMIGLGKLAAAKASASVPPPFSAQSTSIAGSSASSFAAAGGVGPPAGFETGAAGIVEPVQRMQHFLHDGVARRLRLETADDFMK